MYSLTISTLAGFTTIEGKGLSNMMDRYLAGTRNQADDTVYTLRNAAGVLLRRSEKSAPVIEVPALKLSDAMQRALSSVTKDGYVTGAANTLKALANKGLLQANGAKFQVTDTGRQYARKG
jgi:hypothetical protein